MAEMDEGRLVFGRGPTVPEEEVTDRIRRRAHRLWEEEGWPDGRDLEHWLRAEEEILGARPPDRTQTGGAAGRAPRR